MQKRCIIESALNCINCMACLHNCIISHLMHVHHPLDLDLNDDNNKEPATR